jgi:hypothetical protein
VKTNNSVAAATGVLGLLLISLGRASGQSPTPVLRIGTYESRAIAIAFAHSDLLREQHRGMMAELEQAKAANDEKRVAELQSRGKALQHLLHLQGFSTGSVTNIMDRIKDAIPAVAKDAGVLIIVSKWEVLYRDPSIEYVDVTMPLAMKFNPSPRCLKLMEELPKHEPISLDKLPLDDH